LKNMGEFEKIHYKKICRKVRYPRLEFKTGELTLILPEGYQGEEELIIKHRGWILKQKRLIDKTLKLSRKIEIDPPMEIPDLKSAVRKASEKYSNELGVKINNINFRRMKTRWGSCGTDGNLTFNTFLRFLPERLINFVVFHEVTHRIERRHNERFYRIIEGRFPDMKQMEEKLFAYWFLIQKRVNRRRPPEIPT
jgi:predicted metal-dependent hydrolase